MNIKYYLIAGILYVFSSVLMGNASSLYNATPQNNKFPSLLSVVKGDSILLALGSGGCTFYLSQNEGWRASKLFPLRSGDVIDKVKWLEDKFFAVGRNHLVAASIDGKIWEPIKCAVGGACDPAVSIVSIGKFGEYFYLVSNHGVSRSPDLKRWDYVVGGAEDKFKYSFSDIIQFNKKIVAVGPSIYASDDGNEWSRMLNNIALEKILWNGKQYIGINRKGVYVSQDLIVWHEKYDAPEGVVLSDMTLKNDSLYVIGTDGFLIASQDMNNWTLDRLPTGEANLNSIIAVGDNIVAASDYSRVLTKKSSPGYREYQSSLTDSGAIFYFHEGELINNDFMFVGDDYCSSWRAKSIF